MYHYRLHLAGKECSVEYHHLLLFVGPLNLVLDYTLHLGIHTKLTNAKDYSIRGRAMYVLYIICDI
jgi:hypothetical protein